MPVRRKSNASVHAIFVDVAKVREDVVELTRICGSGISDSSMRLWKAVYQPETAP